ncbi:MAG: EamA family transporter [Actinomycetota bacterium]
MLLGVAAALLWGAADFATALLGRRLPLVAMVVVVQLAGLVVAAGIWLVVRPATDAPAIEYAILALDGIVSAIGYIVVYRSLVLGPIALVSPIAATYAVVAVLLAVVVLGERLGPLLLLGILVTMGGVLLTATDLRAARPRRPEGQPSGVPLALLSALLFGIATFILGRGAQEVGWLPATLLSRTFTAVAAIGIAGIRREPLRLPDRRSYLLVAGLGLLDLVALVAFTYGSTLAPVSLVIAAASTFPLVPVAGGVLFLGERPAPWQYLGIAAVIGGLVYLGLVA